MHLLYLFMTAIRNSEAQELTGLLERAIHLGDILSKTPLYLRHKIRNNELDSSNKRVCSETDRKYRFRGDRIGATSFTDAAPRIYW